MSSRCHYFLGFVIVSLLLLTSIFLQFFAGFNPCPLCILQRLSFASLGIFFLLGFVLYKHYVSRITINFILWLFSSIGIVFAGRQVWLQYFPNPDASECGVNINYMLQVLPVNDVIKKIFSGSAECAQRGFLFLHLTMADWALIWFIFFFIVTGFSFIREIFFKNK